MFEFNLLLIFIIIAALIAIRVKDLLSAVVAVGVGGFGLCIAFLILKAPDLAITQLVVEILCLLILVKATIRRDLPFSTSGRWFFNTLITVCFLGIFIFLGYISLREVPSFGNPIMRVSSAYLSDALEKVHATNVVSAINLNFRAYDTLGEASALFAAVIGITVIMRRKNAQSAEKHKKKED